MQESPNFNTYLSRFQNADKATVLDLREIISGADRRFLESVYERLELYFSHEDFRSQLSIQTRTSIEDAHITNILSYLENIASWQRDGSTPIVGANLQSQIQNITGQVTSFDQQIAGYYFTYLSNSEPLGERIQTIKSLTDAAEQESQGLHDVIENVKSQVNDRKQTFDSALVDLEGKASESLNAQKENGGEILSNIEMILTKAKLLIGSASGHQLGDYYQKLANGRTIAENDSYIKNRGTRLDDLLKNFKSAQWISYISIASVISFVLIMYIIDNPVTLDRGGTILSLICGFGLVIFMTVYVGVKSLALFNARYKGGHDRAAVLWMIGAIISTLATAVYASILIRELSVNGDITWEEIIPKIIVLLAPAYLVRLCIQNYRANAHLSVQYKHRATIMSIAENYSNSTATDATQSANADLVAASHKAKMTILTDAAKIMFAQSESGYITQKEGAGNNGGDMIDSLSNNLR